MHPHLFHGSADVFYVASSSTYASGLCDDIKERQSTLKINAINIIYYLVIGDCLRFISHIIIMMKELTCVS
mgnify:CR=1 FL=1